MLQWRPSHVFKRDPVAIVALTSQMTLLQLGSGHTTQQIPFIKKKKQRRTKCDPIKCLHFLSCLLLLLHFCPTPCGCLRMTCHHQSTFPFRALLCWDEWAPVVLHFTIRAPSASISWNPFRIVVSAPITCGSHACDPLGLLHSHCIWCNGCWRLSALPWRFGRRWWCPFPSAPWPFLFSYYFILPCVIHLHFGSLGSDGLFDNTFPHYFASPHLHLCVHLRILLKLLNSDQLIEKEIQLFLLVPFPLRDPFSFLLYNPFSFFMNQPLFCLRLFANHSLLCFTIPSFGVLLYVTNNIGDKSTHPSHPRVISNSLDSTNHFIHHFLYRRVDLSFSQMIKSSLNKQ